jgi:hypothetical protein
MENKTDEARINHEQRKVKMKKEKKEKEENKELRRNKV